MVRIKHRYLLVDIVFPNPQNSKELPSSVAYNRPCPKWFDTGSLIRLIRANVAENFGDYGSGAIGGSLTVKYFSQATSTAIIRCPRAHYRLVWAALTFASYLARYSGKRDEEKLPCIFRVVRVSGTIKKAEEEAIRRARRQILEVKGQDQGSLESFFPVSGIEDDDQIQSEEDITMQDYDSEND